MVIIFCPDLFFLRVLLVRVFFVRVSLVYVFLVLKVMFTVMATSVHLHEMSMKVSMMMFGVWELA